MSVTCSSQTMAKCVTLAADCVINTTNKMIVSKRNMSMRLSPRDAAKNVFTYSRLEIC